MIVHVTDKIANVIKKAFNVIMDKVHIYFNILLDLVIILTIIILSIILLFQPNIWSLLSITFLYWWGDKRDIPLVSMSSILLIILWFYFVVYTKS